jgi:D-alanyl-D-alanine carboxypeptidase
MCNFRISAVVVLICIITGCINLKVESGFQQVVNNELNENLPGILVNVYSPDKNIYWSGAAGFSDRYEKTDLRPDQTFRIASVSKTYTAATVLRLWEEGKLNLDDPITVHISSEHAQILKEGGYQADQITIRHLLTHSGGLADHTNSSLYTYETLINRPVWTRTDQVRDLVRFKTPAGAPGEKFSYSDTGYILLGEIIENSTGKFWGEAAIELLRLRELGMKNTYPEAFDGDYSGKRIHQYYEGADTYDFHPSHDYYGGGGLLSTVSDLSRFYYSLFHNQVFTHHSTLDTLLSTVSYASAPALDYRMGIWKIDINGMTAFTHTGFYGTQVIFIPEMNTTIAVNYSQAWKEKGVAPVISKILTLLQNDSPQ